MKPLTKDAWDLIKQPAVDLVNAIVAEDTVLEEIHRNTLFDTLDKIEGEFGSHPQLLATRADFLDDYTERKNLYNEALFLVEQTSNQVEVLEIQDSLKELELENL